MRLSAAHCARRLGAALVVGLGIAAAAGCASTSAPERTTVIEELGTEGVTSRQVRLSSEHALDFNLRLVEIAADSIMAVTDDPAVSLNALAWKANAIPALQKAIYHTDPMVGYTDGWVLVELMEDFFERGRGSDWFGSEQSIAIETMNALTDRAARIVREGADSTRYAWWSGFVDRWVQEHQLDNDLFLHETVSSAFTAELATAPSGGLSALGSLQELAVDAQAMAQTYLAYTPKTVMWQVELMVYSMMDTTRLSPLLRTVDRLAVTRAATHLMEEMPDLIRNERAAALAEVEALTEGSLSDLLAVASAERQIVLAELAAILRAERAAMLDGVEGTLLLALEQGRAEATAVIDHTLWRVAQGAAVLILLVGIAFLIVLVRFGPRRNA